MKFDERSNCAGRSREEERGKAVTVTKRSSAGEHSDGLGNKGSLTHRQVVEMVRISICGTGGLRNGRILTALEAAPARHLFGQTERQNRDALANRSMQKYTLRLRFGPDAALRHAAPRAAPPRRSGSTARLAKQVSGLKLGRVRGPRQMRIKTPSLLPGHGAYAERRLPPARRRRSAGSQCAKGER